MFQKFAYFLNNSPTNNQIFILLLAFWRFIFIFLLSSTPSGITAKKCRKAAEQMFPLGHWPKHSQRRREGSFVYLDWLEKGGNGRREGKKKKEGEKGVLLAIVAMMNWPIGRGREGKGMIRNRQIGPIVGWGRGNVWTK
jgi:hypothetical protein